MKNFIKPKVKNNNTFLKYNIINVYKFFLLLYIFFVTPTILSAQHKKPNYDPNFTYFTIGAGPASGTYFAFASSLASVLTRPQGSPPCERGGSCGVDNMIAIAYATDGSKQNLELLTNRKIDSALVQTNEFLRDTTNFRIIGTIFPEYLHAIVLGNSNLHHFSEIKGKNISMGPSLSGTSDIVQPILETLGLFKQDYYIVAHDLGQSCDALSSKNIDTLLYMGGGPIPSVNSLAKCEQIRFLSLTPQQQLKLTSKYKFLEAVDIPSGLYWGVAKTPTVGVYAQWIVRADMPDDKVYALAKSYYHPKTQKFLRDNFPNLNLLSRQESLKHVGKYLHPGAAKYYQENPK